MALDEIVEKELAAIRELIRTNERARDVQADGEAAQRHLEKAELDARLNRMNEFRQAMADQAGRFIQRPEFEEAKAAGVERYEINRRHIDQKQRSMLTSSLSLMVAAVAGAWFII